MGLIDIIKPMSTVLSSAINKSLQHQEKNSWEHYLCAMQPAQLFVYCLLAYSQIIITFQLNLTCQYFYIEVNFKRVL